METLIPKGFSQSEFKEKVNPTIFKGLVKKMKNNGTPLFCMDNIDEIID